MEALLFPIALVSLAAVAMGVVYSYQALVAPRQAIRVRIGTGRVGAGLGPRLALRDRRSRLPLVDRLPLSAESRARMALELERAGQPLKVSEYLGLRIGFALAGSLLGFAAALRFGAPGWLAVVGMLVLMLAGWFLPHSYVARRRKRRLEAIERQLPDALTAVAKALRAGSGLLQGLGYAAQETNDPLGTELRTTLRDLELGADAEEVFADLCRRTGSPDLDIAVTALIIQRTVGGNLSEILTNVTKTIRERAKLRGEVRVMTSRQRLTGNIVAVLPVLVAGAFLGLNPDMGRLLFEEPAGRIALAIGIAFELLGLWLIRRLAVVEV